MKEKCLALKNLILLILAIFVISCNSKAETPKNIDVAGKEGQKMGNNTQPFGNSQLNSLLPYNLSSKGAFAWKLEYNPENISGNATALLLLDDSKAILDYSMVFFGIDLYAQKVLGFQRKSLNTFVSGNKQEFYAFSDYRLLKLRFDSFQTPPADHYFVPGLGDYSELVAFIPGQDSFIAGVRNMGNPRFPQKAIGLLEKTYNGFNYTWNINFPGIVPPPPVSLDGNFVIAQKDLISIVGSDGKVKKEIKGEFIPICCSIGVDNLIYMICKTKSDYVIKAMDFEGNTRWECVTSISKPNQPPIVSNELTIFIVGNSKIEAFTNGQKLWEFLLTGSDSASQLVSVSQDGMLLVSDGNRVICLNKTGELVWKFSIAKGGVFKTQPVLDSVGKVFVVTDRSIFALK
jgi:hypothetical protein